MVYLQVEVKRDNSQLLNDSEVGIDENDDKTWSLTKEYELNKNNYIFTDKFPLKRILSDLSKENDKLKKKR